jgi:hypothetical protein
MADHIIEKFNSGVHNLDSNETTPKDSAQDSLNWLTRDGRLELSRGSVIVGAEGAAGKVSEIWFGYKINGDKVQYRKADTKIQYLNGTVWTDIVTGLNAADEYTFQNYSSLSGSFTYATGPGGIFKFHNANPGSYIDLYDSTKNFKGYCLIDKARMLMWGLTNDPTGLYGSYIDAQNGTVYTSVTNEVLATGDGVQTTFSGTLAFKGANPKANCFGLQINTNPASVTATDNFLGIISGTGVSGTINYVTGAYSITFTTPPAGATQIRVSYQWENSNVKGITDFTKSATRLAGEGFVLRQDEGGDAIQQVILGIDDSYYSIKEYSVYKYTADSTDTKPDNNVFRKDIGVPTRRSAVSTGRGIVFLNTSNPERPELTVLEKNPLGDNIIATPLLPHFKFENYNYDDAVVTTWERYIVITCKTLDNLTNNRMLLCNITANTVDISHYQASCLAKDRGLLYAGSPLTYTVYRLFDGWDDDGVVVANQWTSKAELYNSERLKKFRRLRLKGQIQQSQVYEVYLSFDDGDFSLVGTVRGDGSYVDTTTPGAVGSQMVGDVEVGSEGNSETTYPYFVQLKVKTPKYRKRAVKIVATGLGYVSINYLMDWDILSFEQRIPKRYRMKENVSLDGKSTDLDNPEF